MPGGDTLGKRPGPQLYEMMDDHNARSVHSTLRERGGTSDVSVRRKSSRALDTYVRACVCVCVCPGLGDLSSQAWLCVGFVGLL